jgi:hypothetical protein
MHGAPEGYNIARLLASYDAVWRLGDITAGYNIKTKRLYFYDKSEMKYSSLCDERVFEREYIEINEDIDINHGIAFNEFGGKLTNIASFELGNMVWKKGGQVDYFVGESYIGKAYEKAELLASRRDRKTYVIGVDINRISIDNVIYRELKVDYYIDSKKVKSYGARMSGKAVERNVRLELMRYDDIVLEIVFDYGLDSRYMELLRKDMYGEYKIPENLEEISYWMVPGEEVRDNFVYLMRVK